MRGETPSNVIMRHDHTDDATNLNGPTAGSLLPHLVHPCVPDSPIPPAASPTAAQVRVTLASPAHTPLQPRSPVSPRPQQASPRAQYARPHPPATKKSPDVASGPKLGKAISDCPAPPPASPRIPHVRFSGGECVAAQACEILPTACLRATSSLTSVDRASLQKNHIDLTYPSSPSSNGSRASPPAPRSLSNPVPPATTPCTNPSSSVSLTANNSPVPPPSTPCNGIPSPLFTFPHQESRFRFLLGHKTNSVPVPPPTTPRGEHATVQSNESLPYPSSGNGDGTEVHDPGLIPELLSRLPDIVTRSSSLSDAGGRYEHRKSQNGDGLSSPSVLYPGSPSLQDAGSSCSPRSTVRGSPHRTRKGSRSSSPTSPCVKLMDTGVSFREALPRGHCVIEAESQTRHNGPPHVSANGSQSQSSNLKGNPSQSWSTPLDNSPSIESELSGFIVVEPEVSRLDGGSAGVVLPELEKPYGCVGSYGSAGARDSLNRLISPSIDEDQEQAVETINEEQEKAVETIQRAYRRRVVRSWVRISVQGCGGYLKWTFGERGARVSNFTINRTLLSDPSCGLQIMKGDRLYKINNIYVFNMPKAALKAVWKEERGAGSRTLLCVVRPRE